MTNLIFRIVLFDKRLFKTSNCPLSLAFESLLLHRVWSRWSSTSWVHCEFPSDLKILYTTPSRRLQAVSYGITKFPAYHLHAKKTNNGEEFVLNTRDTRDNGVRPEWTQIKSLIKWIRLSSVTEWATIHENVIDLGKTHLSSSAETPSIWWVIPRIREKNNVFMFKTRFTFFTLDKLTL